MKRLETELVHLTDYTGFLKEWKLFFMTKRRDKK